MPSFARLLGIGCGPIPTGSFFPMPPNRLPGQQQTSSGGEVLRFGLQSGAPGPDLLTRRYGMRPFAALIHIYVPIPLAAPCNRCSDIANLSAHLHRLPTPPPYLRRMRLLPGQGRRCWMANAAAGCSWHSSCKSPRAQILVLGTSGAHWPTRWPQFELTERVAKS